MKSSLLISLCVAMLVGINAVLIDSCETSRDTCPLFALGTDVVSADELLDQGLALGRWVELYTYELNSPSRYGKCQHIWRPRYSSDVLWKKTTCYNLDLQKCESYEWNITLINDDCGRARDNFGENSLTKWTYYSQDIENYLWISVCYEFNEDGDCILGYAVLLVRDKRRLSNGELQLTGLPWPSISADLKNNFNMDFTHSELRHAWIGPECGFDGNIVYTLSGGLSAGINYVLLLCVSVVTLSF